MTLNKIILSLLAIVTLIPQESAAFDRALVGRKIGGELLTSVGILTLASTYFFMQSKLGLSLARTKLRKQGTPIAKGHNPFASELRNVLYVLGVAAVGFGIWLKR